MDIEGVLKGVAKWLAILLVGMFLYLEVYVKQYTYGPLKDQWLTSYCPMINQQDWCLETGCVISVGKTIPEITADVSWKCTY